MNGDIFLGTDCKRVFTETAAPLHDAYAASLRRNAELEAALVRALPYVRQFAENVPLEDGGFEATGDLSAVIAALG